MDLSINSKLNLGTLKVQVDNVCLIGVYGDFKFVIWNKHKEVAICWAIF
jgi:hypothetical protein